MKYEFFFFFKKIIGLIVHIETISDEFEPIEGQRGHFFWFLVIGFQTITIVKYNNEKKIWTPTTPVCTSLLNRKINNFLLNL